ncbi:MAG: thiamine pyrophosphate-binding protein [Rhodospirillaceae bacterium]
MKSNIAEHPPVTASTREPMKAKIGGHILIESLVLHGADWVFGVPGESYLAALDGLYELRDRIRFVACRQEGGAANMAEAYGKLTGRPGICFVTRGPGATNASIGVHTAFQDSTPMILFVGQVASDVQDREGFQEIDYRRMYGQMSKWVAQIDRADRIPEYVARAFQTATSGRQGPVVLALPEDMLLQKASVTQLVPYRRNLAWPDPQRLREMTEMLAAAKRPLMLVGGSGWTPQGCAGLQAFAERWNLPVACGFRFQDTFDNRHPNYAGEVGSTLGPALRQRILDADLILTVGLRLGEGTTRGYTLLDPPRPRQKLIHVHAGAEELGSVYQADVMIQASMPAFAASIESLPSSASPPWSDWTRAAAQDYRDHVAPGPSRGKGVDMRHVVKTLQAVVPEDTIYTSGAGNYAGWFNRYLRYRGFAHGSRTQLAPSSGAMGYGVPAGVAAKLVHSDRTVVSISGDGCFLMNGQEIATAVQYGAPVVFIVVNNGMYGTIRMKQEMDFSERVIGTDLKNPDFAALARAYGANGYVVSTSAEFEPALRAALASDVASLIEIRTDPEVISTTTTITALREKARHA